MRASLFLRIVRFVRNSQSKQSRCGVMLSVQKYGSIRSACSSSRERLFDGSSVKTCTLRRRIIHGTITTLCAFPRVRSHGTQDSWSIRELTSTSRSRSLESTTTTARLTRPQVWWGASLLEKRAGRDQKHLTTGLGSLEQMHGITFQVRRVALCRALRESLRRSEFALADCSLIVLALP